MKAIKIIALVLVCAIVVGIAAFGIIKKDEVKYVKAAMDNAVATIKDGTWQDIIAGSGGGDEDKESEAPDVEFVAGTYGGVEFTSIEDVVNYYNTVYNNTKTQTAQYQNSDGSVATFYALVGEEHLNLKTGSLLVDGKPNSILDGAVPGIMSKIGGGVNGLSPSDNRDPNLDNDETGASLTTSRVTVDDILKCGIVDNGDGTITMTLVPKGVSMSHKGMDAQGHFFNSLGAIDGAIEELGVKWASGTTEENCKVMYEDGSAVVTIDTATNTVVKADYHMVVNIDVVHANFLVLTDRSASLTLYYDCNFPASDDYLLQKKGLTRM